MKRITILFAASFLMLPASAEICDYAPSKLVAGGTVAVAATGAGMKAAGLYALTNATTGAAMLGSTAAGTSAAGTVGIIGGTAGTLGTAGAVVMSPWVIGGAVVLGGGAFAYEKACSSKKGHADDSKDGSSRHSNGGIWKRVVAWKKRHF